MKKKILIIIATVMTVCILATMFAGCSQSEEEFYTEIKDGVEDAAMSARELWTKLTDGMTICIEPMVNAGTKGVYLAKNGWEVHTADRRKSAHYELTVVIRKGAPEVLSTFDFIEKNVEF